MLGIVADASDQEEVTVLVAAVLRGDVTAIASFHKRYYPILASAGRRHAFKIASRMSLDGNEFSLDLPQEAWMFILQGQRRFKDGYSTNPIPLRSFVGKSHAELCGFLRKCATNYWNDLYGRDRRADAIPKPKEIAGTELVFDELEGEGREPSGCERCILDAIRDLPPKQRELAESILVSTSYEMQPKERATLSHLRQGILTRLTLSCADCEVTARMRAWRAGPTKNTSDGDPDA